MSDPVSPAPPSPQAPRWRRALAWLGGHLRRFAVWVWARLRAGATLAWGNVRDGERSAPRRALWAAGGLAGLGAVLGVAGLVLLVAYTVVLWPFTPSVADLRNAREVDPSTVVSADGVTLTRYARQGREWRSLDDISPRVVEALVATEDRRFYTHGGVDLVGWGSVAVGAVTGDGLRGASTITQQLARNLFPDEIGNAASVTRKLREGITALKIERVYSKDEILELYLNTVPFLYNAHGIEMAARTYYSTDAGSLDRLQAATLVGMLKGTSSYNPYRHPERAKARRNVVLGQLVRFGDLPAAEAASLGEQPLGLRFQRQTMQTSRAPHFTEHVRKQLEDWADRAGYSLYGDGLTVHTTLDWRMQQQAQASATRFGDALQAVADVEWGRASTARLGTTTAPYVTASRSTRAFDQFWTVRRSAADAFVRATATYRRAVEAGEEPDAVLARLRGTRSFVDSLQAVKMRLEVAVTAVEPETGHVKVWVGSRAFSRSAYDHVARAKRQPGSIFKPFLYARALEEGYRPDDQVLDADVAIEMADGVVWQPTNASGTTSDEMISLRDGLAYSKNTVAARLVDDVGARDVARTARRMGVTSDLEAVPSLALGTSEVSLLEMTDAYATIAAGGVHRPPVTVTHITDRDGHEVARFEPRSDRALDPDVAVDLLDMMRGVVDRGTGTEVRSAFGGRGDLAGKTGTTQDGADGWFLLMRPDLVTGAWVGFDDPRVTFRSSYWGQGGHNALRVVGDLNRSFQRDGLVSTALEFPRPEPEPPGGPSLWGRVTDWVGGLGDRLFDRGTDLPDDYGPRTPGRRADDPDPTRDRRRDRDRREDVLAENADWLNDAWDEVEQIDDPMMRQAAREVLRRATQEIAREGWRDGWADRVGRAQDRAVDDARREIEREIARALDGDGPGQESRRAGPFADETAGDEGFEMEPLEEAPVTPEPPPAPQPQESPRAGDGGRIGF